MAPSKIAALREVSTRSSQYESADLDKDNETITSYAYALPAISLMVSVHRALQASLQELHLYSRSI